VLNALGEMQRILVLGGKSDIACAVLTHLPLSKDAEIILCGRNMSEFKIPDGLKGFQIECIDIDFTNIDDSKKSIENVFLEGDIDLAIIAYATLGVEVLQLTSDQYADVLHTNFYSQALVLNQINTRMILQAHGQILQISSVAGIRPRKVNFVYGVSKFGVDFIAQGLQKVNSKKNVFITILRPGFVYTKMTNDFIPAPFALDAAAVAKIAAYGLSRKKRIIYAPRFLFFVMLVLRILPEKIFRLVDR
jgi:decaprenylphospho-beta-D-erythro-pentofuranosid-2-ulose 2-reductase